MFNSSACSLLFVAPPSFQSCFVRETQEAYEVLVNALERGAELGECVLVVETELAKRELPGDVRRANREVIAPASVEWGWH